ncbi:MAG: nickel pincer cofactor biosynthesis protein LarC [Desulfarculus sp.]|nr:nickel pincer cofactor biosynthesis protein LarC [Desulfarculus sp.]
MPRILYIDACGGLSGDMLAGALMDLGWPLAELEALVAALGLEGVGLERARVEHMGVAASRLAVTVHGQVPDQPPQHDHGHGHHHGHHHHHDHGHGHHHPEQTASRRGLPEILALLERLPTAIAQPAARVFQRLAGAEAKVHGSTPQEVHFHEVGAVDAMVDVVAFCAGLNWLRVERVVCSPLPLGRGFVDCAHGRLPLPAPAVVNLLEGLPVTSWPAAVETVTPTGAALVSTLAGEFGPLPAMRLKAQGWGGGSRPSQGGPNLVRLMLGEAAEELGRDTVAELVCHLDDQSPEDLPIIFQRLLDEGALDVAAAPLYMKKGRPGLMLTVLCPPERAEDMARLVLTQTTSLGLRLRLTERRILPREQISVDTPWGPVLVKRARVGDAWRYHPEADEVARICRETGLAPGEVRARLLAIRASQPD